jgi:hypothetical protein
MLVSPRLSERGRASEPGTAKCLARNCRDFVPITSLFCDRHRRLLWDDQYDQVYAKFRPNGKQTKVFKTRLEIARDQIQAAEGWGHREPRDEATLW